MKKILFFAFVFLNVSLFAQPTEKGNIMIDPYYGGPNFGGILARAFPLVNDKKVTSMGPFGLRAEYMVKDNIGLGIDFIYNAFTMSGTIDSLFEDNSLYQTFPYKVSVGRTRVHVRMNYHFSREERVDAYVGVGLGLSVRKVGVETEMVSRQDYTGIGGLFPLNMRLAVGIRYYFIRNLGIQAEMGLGGPLVSAGLSLRL